MNIETEGLTPNQIEKLKALQEEMLAENTKPISRYHLDEGWFCRGPHFVRLKDLRKGDPEYGRLRETKEEVRVDFNAWQCRLRLLKRIAELNEGWKPDFTSGGKENYHFRLWLRIGGISVDSCLGIQTYHKDFYFKSTEIGGQLLDEFTDDEIKAAMWGCV